jgi:catechol 2,3-dioxygenase-like lactoylglutathione lyase family enzyme
MHFGPAVPILRMFDPGEARAFYLDYLGFTVDFEHRFDATAPLYLGVSRGACRLHLTQHYGDASPGAQVRIPVTDIDGFHAALIGKSHPYCRPSIELMPWGTREMRLTDPFANRLAFFEQAGTLE